MIIVTKEFDNGTLEIFDTTRYEIEVVENSRIVSMYKKGVKIHDIDIMDNKLVYVRTYNFIRFSTEDEVYEYIDQEDSINKYSIEEENGDYYLLLPYRNVVSVQYVVFNIIGRNINFISETNAYTHYFSESKRINKIEAIKLSYAMTKRNKHGITWKFDTVEHFAREYSGLYN